jgi:eukaryotic-like serine/threonine-protein kinase
MGEEDELIAGRYRLAGRLGRGGMGEVWQAYDERLHRKVAVKQLILPAELDGEQSAQAMRQAVREGRIAARLQHKNVVTLFDVIEEDGQAYLILEYLPSSSLSQVLAERGTLPPDEAARIGAQVAEALDAAHAAGIVHRDVKPGNVLIGDEGTAKITDFGISRAIEDASTMTTGMVVGTPAYLSPEVAKGEQATFSSDVFSLGATLYTAIEGMPPVGQSDNAMALLFRAASGEIDAPTHAGAMTDVLERMLSADPDHRPTMSQVSETLAGLPGAADQPAADEPAAEHDPDQTEIVPPAPAPTAAEPPIEPPADVTPPPEPAAARPLPEPPTERLAVLPAVEPHQAHPRPPARKRRTKVLAAAVVAVLLVAGGVVALLWDWSGSTDQTAAPPSSTTSSVASANAEPTSSTAASTAANPPPAAPPSSNPPPVNPPPGNVNASVPADAAAAVTEYYALMPANRQQAWDRLTARFQRSPAGGTSGYERFWSQVNSVKVSGVDPASASVVGVTVEYHFKDSRVVVEQHRYTLVQQGGQWKLDAVAVLSSRTLTL